MLPGVEQGTDYEALTELWKAPSEQWNQDTHVVNIAMMLKYEAVVCDLLGTEYKDIPEKLYSVLMKYNGTAVDTFTGDECLSGLSPIQGTELCSVVELMYSFETLYLLTGDVKWAQRLETVAFNALPATISDDMWTHQYDQMSNQIACTPFEDKPIFRTNNGEAHLFGLEPHYGCCTSNFGQGWPKLALSAFMIKENEVVCGVALPSRLCVNMNGVPVTVTLDTQYPFKKRMNFTVSAPEATDMKFKVRIPDFAKSLTVNGVETQVAEYLEFDGFDKGDTRIEIKFEILPVLVKRPYELYSLKYGSLVFSANIKARYEKHEYVRDGVERKFPYCDYSLYPCEEWNFAFASGRITVEERTLGSVPFSSTAPPVVAQVDMCHIDWEYETGYKNVCAKFPASIKAVDTPFKVELYPYGCAKLRMTEIPLAETP